MRAIDEFDNPHLNTLNRLRMAEPFAEFDVVTKDGHKYHVDKRMEFAWSETQVFVANEKKSGIHRLPLETIQAINEDATQGAA